MEFTFRVFACCEAASMLRAPCMLHWRLYVLGFPACVCTRQRGVITSALLVLAAATCSIFQRISAIWKIGLRKSDWKNHVLIWTCYNQTAVCHILPLSIETLGTIIIDTLLNTRCIPLWASKFFLISQPLARSCMYGLRKGQIGLAKFGLGATYEQPRQPCSVWCSDGDNGWYTCNWIQQLKTEAKTMEHEVIWNKVAYKFWLQKF